MQEELKRIIKSSSFKIIGDFIYAKTDHAPNLDDCFFISKDDDEITAVFKAENLTRVNIKERNQDLWKLIEIKVSVPFYSVGFLATIANSIAEEDMNVLIVSTYSKDYILVKTELAEKAKGALLELGFNEK